MCRKRMARRVIGPDRQNRAVDRVDIRDRDVAHFRSLPPVSDSHRKPSDYRMRDWPLRPYRACVPTCFLILLLLGCLTGLTTVLFGFGGGFVTVPAVYAVTAAHAASGAMHVAVATSAAVMIVNASIATLTHARSGMPLRPHLHPLAWFIAIGAAMGAMAATFVPDRALQLLFAAYLAITLADIVLRDGFITALHRNRPPTTFGSSVGGVGIGAVAAFLGVGGSVLTVPLLRRRGMRMAQATALANPLSIPVAVVASLVYATAGQFDSPSGFLGSINLTAAAALLLGALPTIVALERAPIDIPDRVHAIAYPAFLSIVLIAMVTTAVS
ncbi:sulfite exporter TauE/SafE family protein [Nocardia sp. NPDC055321]